MDVIYLRLSELQKLIESPILSDRVKLDDTIKCISSVEILYEVERIKKGDISALALKLVKTKTCELYNAIDCGYVVPADLNINSLENGLFKVGEDYYSFDLWDDAVQLMVDPATSIKMISLRSFDSVWGTDLCSGVKNNQHDL